MTHNLLIEATKAIFEDGRFYLTKMTSAEYARPLDVFSGSSLGQHTRHWIEFFQCLLGQKCNEEIICYDKRERNLALENDPNQAIQALDAIEKLLSQAEIEGNLLLESEMTDGTTVLLPTSFIRELWFVIEHAVHHLALIKVGLKTEFPDWLIPKHFGVANSTLRHQNQVIGSIKN